MKGEESCGSGPCEKGDDVLVEFVDTGAGIPLKSNQNLRSFFTTKPMGEGTDWGWIPCIASCATHRGNVTFVSRRDTHVFAYAARQKRVRRRHRFRTPAHNLLQSLSGARLLGFPEAESIAFLWVP